MNPPILNLRNKASLASLSMRKTDMRKHRYHHPLLLSLTIRPFLQLLLPLLSYNVMQRELVSESSRPAGPV